MAFKQHEEGDNEDLGPLSEETVHRLRAEHGIGLPDWQPRMAFKPDPKPVRKPKKPKR